MLDKDKIEKSLLLGIIRTKNWEVLLRNNITKDCFYLAREVRFTHFLVFKLRLYYIFVTFFVTNSVTLNLKKSIYFSLRIIYTFFINYLLIFDIK